MATTVAGAMRGVQRLVREAGPYLLIELVLPGGTLIALTLYLYRKGHLRSVDDLRAFLGGVLRTAGRLFDHLALAWEPPSGSARGRAGGAVGGLPSHLLLPGR